MSGRLKSHALAAALGFAVAGFAVAGTASAEIKKAEDVHIIFVTHGQANDVYWSVVKNGVEAGPEGDGQQGRVPCAGDLRRGADGAPDRRGDRRKAGRAGRLDPRRRPR